MFNFSRKFIYFFPLLTGLLLTSGFLEPKLFWIIGFSLVPLFFFVQKCPSKKMAFWGGYLTGLIFFGGIMRWILASHPLDWIGIDNFYLSICLVFGAWLVIAGFLALFFGFFALAFSKLKTGSWFDLFLAPGLWIIFEHLRAWGFNFLNFGPGTLLGAHYTLGDLGYSLVNQGNFLQFASFSGVLGLGFLVVFVNFGIFTILRSGDRKNKIIFTALFLISLILINLLGFHLKNAKENQIIEKIPIALIQGNFSSQFHYAFEERQQTFLAYLQLAKEATANPSNPQIIILPEDTRLFSWLKKINPEPEKFLKEFFSGRKKLIITSGRIEDADGKIKSIMTYYDTQKGIIGQYQKRFLMPVGEYLPYWLNGFAKLIGKQDWIENFNTSRGYSKGNETIVVETDWGKISGLMCSGVLSSELTREITKEGAEFLIFLSSNGSFRGAKPLLSQILAMSQLRAVENERYVVQSANKGWLYIINPAGEVEASSFSLGNKVVYGNISFIQSKSFYTKYGDWILILAALFIGVSAREIIKMKYRKEPTL